MPSGSGGGFVKQAPVTHTLPRRPSWAKGSIESAGQDLSEAVGDMAKCPVEDIPYYQQRVKARRIKLHDAHVMDAWRRLADAIRHSDESAFARLWHSILRLRALSF